MVVKQETLVNYKISKTDTDFHLLITSILE